MMAESLGAMEHAVPTKRIFFDYSDNVMSNPASNDFRCFVGTSNMTTTGDNCIGSSVAADSGSLTCDSGFSELTPPRCLSDDLPTAHGVKRSCSSTEYEPAPKLQHLDHESKMNCVSRDEALQASVDVKDNRLSVASQSTSPCEGQDCADDQSVSSGEYSQPSLLGDEDEEDDDDDDDDDEEEDDGDEAGGGTTSASSMTPAMWVQQLMRRGRDPRAVLSQVLGTEGSNFPPTMTDAMLWRFILNMLTENTKRRDRLRYVNTIDDAVRLIKRSRRIIILTGAGVSVSCGIPDFRSKDGIYARLAVDFPNLPDPQAMFDINFFRKDPRPFFKFAREIYPGQFSPSLCHRFIKSLESSGKLLRNYTQNIDTLEQVAGITRVIQCHGSFATATCQLCKFKVDADAIKEDIFEQRLPLCPHCTPPSTPLFDPSRHSGNTPTPPLTPLQCSHETYSSNIPNNSNSSDQRHGDDIASRVNNSPELELVNNSCNESESHHHCLSHDSNDIGCEWPDDDISLAAPLSPPPLPIMKPDIVFFGEGLPDEFHDSITVDQEVCDLLIVVGSSLKVRPVALIPSSIPPEIPQILINREPLNHLTFDIELLGDCDVILNELCHRIGGNFVNVASDNTRLEEVRELPPYSSEHPVNMSGVNKIGESSVSSANIEDTPHPKNEQDIEALRACWAPKVRESVAARLPPKSFFYNGGHRYVFKGAEVYYDPDEAEADDDSSDMSDYDDLIDNDATPQSAADETSESNATTPAHDVQSCSAVAASNSLEHIVRVVDEMEGETPASSQSSFTGFSVSHTLQHNNEPTLFSCSLLRVEGGRSQSCESTDSIVTTSMSSADELLSQHNHHSLHSDMEALLSGSEHDEHEVSDWMSLHASLDAHSLEHHPTVEDVHFEPHVSSDKYEASASDGGTESAMSSSMVSRTSVTL